ncbi:hypothetical protein BDZ91DRAFT_766222 [Kalaharituber pfeilii]|nr:hypothetical protein BDZ91DRAFT_766222 [Kalaharituber pfeilii]
MFMGLVEAIGNAHLGDSISVNGTCLIIKSFNATTFVVDLAPETLRRTNLSPLTAGSKVVNLERAVAGEVEGHVDSVVDVIKTEMDGESMRMRVKPKGEGSKEIIGYIIEKGFVAVNGASLTVTRMGGGGEGDKEKEGETEGEGWFGVMLAVYTQEKIVTSVKGKQIEGHLVGGAVNKVVDTGMKKVVEKKLKEAGIGNYVG